MLQGPVSQLKIQQDLRLDWSSPEMTLKVEA